MCGICGLVKRARAEESDGAMVRCMNAAMVHRGPDGEGAFASDHVRLGMRRLSIIDLEGGWQPLYNEDRTVAVMANGEVYNFVELREDLQSRGHTFATGSDCETLVHLYEEYGLDFVQHLRGMYAVALWDETRKRLLLLRDRVGEKPLYLFHRDDTILFASEMKALLASGKVPFDLDPGAVSDYFHYNYVPEPRTMVKGVQKLPAGHLCVIQTEPWSVETHRYWRLEDAHALDGDPVDHLREQMEDVSRIILRSDVPVGVALSAGLDSSTVAVLAAKKSPDKIHALTVGFEGGGWRDERGGARDLAKHLGMPFHDVEIRLSDVVEHFPENSVAKDDPIADIASQGYAALARLARDNNIPVLLQGQGTDELYWGYVWLRRAMGASMRKFGQAGALPPDYRPFRSLLPRNLHKTGLRDYAFLLAGKLQGWGCMAGGGPDRLRFYDQSKTYQMGAYAVPRLFTRDYLDKLHDHDPAAFFTVREPRPNLDVLITKLACESYLLENGIAQGDRLAMASSVELRLPFVDYRFMETVVGCRKRNPDHHLMPKHWFRRVVADILPDWVLRRPKTGFSPPTSLWMNALRERYGASLLDGYLVEDGILRPDAVRRLLKPHSQLTAWPVTLYKALVLEWWCRGMQRYALREIS